MHTLFVREHNRLCDLLKSKYPTKDEEFYFENARRILIAEMQNIVYSEYLPVVLGENAMKEGKLGILHSYYIRDRIEWYRIGFLINFFLLIIVCCRVEQKFQLWW